MYTIITIIIVVMIMITIIYTVVIIPYTHRGTYGTDVRFISMK